MDQQQAVQQRQETSASLRALSLPLPSSEEEELRWEEIPAGARQRAKGRVFNAFAYAASGVPGVGHHHMDVQVDASFLPDVKDQGASGHCAAFSAVADWEAVLKRAGWEEEDYAISVGHVIASKKEEEPFSALCAYASDAVQSGGSISAALKKSGGKGVSDGGRVDVIHTVIKKHGLVTKSARPDSPSATDAKALNMRLGGELAKAKSEIRHLAASGAVSADGYLEIIQRALSVIRSLLDLSYGKAPASFSARGGVHTAVSFYGKVDEVYQFTDKVLVMDAETDRDHKTATTVRLPRPIQGEDGWRVAKMTMGQIKTAAVKALRENWAVPLELDFRRGVDKDNGVAHLEEEEEDIPSLAAALTKEERVDGGDLRKTHAILLVGAALRQDTPTAFRLMNSHGSGHGNGGFLTATAEWFDRNVFTALLPSHCVEKAIRERTSSDHAPDLEDDHPVSAHCDGEDEEIDEETDEEDEVKRLDNADKEGEEEKQLDKDAEERLDAGEDEEDMGNEELDRDEEEEDVVDKEDRDDEKLDEVEDAKIKEEPVKFGERQVKVKEEELDEGEEINKEDEVKAGEESDDDDEELDDFERKIEEEEEKERDM